MLRYNRNHCKHGMPVVTHTCSCGPKVLDVIFHLVKESLNSSHQQKWFCRQNVGQSRSPRYCSKSQLLTDDVNVTNVTNADGEESDNDIEDDQTSSESGSDEDIA